MTVISTTELADRLKKNDKIVLIMTVGSNIYEQGHIPGSVHSGSRGNLDEIRNKRTEVIVYCNCISGSRSEVVYRLLHSAGYKNVRHYQGGLCAWRAQGFPIEVGQSTSARIFRFYKMVGALVRVSMTIPESTGKRVSVLPCQYSVSEPIVDDRMLIRMSGND